MLGLGPARRGEAPPYSLWVDLYDPPLQAGAIPDAGGTAPVAVVILGDARGVARADAGGDAGGERMERTLGSVRRQRPAPDCVVIQPNAAAMGRISAPWLLLVAAGEILAPHALACFAKAARDAPDSLCIYADCDEWRADGRRAPLFKPATPDPWLLASGLLTRGACLFRTETVLATLTNGAAPASAQAWRLALARGLSPASIRAISLILTHETGPSPAPGCNMLEQSGKSAGTPTLPAVSILVASSCTSPHALRCLQRLERRTDYPDLEILVALSRREPHDRRQLRILDALSKLRRVRVLDLAESEFNYARINNRAAALAKGALLLLLNDDVFPLHDNWLRDLAGAMTPGTGIVGPRLLHGNGAVQHAGVILGLANLCEHAFRLREPGDGGPHGLARLSRQVSAVTAACLLVRADLYKTLGGLDEGFRIALNDVDFCLRAAATGAAIRFAAHIDLIHYESVSLGRHYSGARAALEAVEVRRLRERWGRRLLEDPYYNLSASLELGREFTPAFPPRHTALSWIAAEPLALS